MKVKTLLDLLLKSFLPNENKPFVISEFSQIEKLKESNSSRKYEYLNTNKEKIHKILYESDQIIKIHSNIPEKTLVNLFYLTLLIKHQKCFTNYIYNYEFIENINNSRKNSKNDLTVFILSMIIIELINNYKEAYDYYDRNNEEKLNQLLKENLIIRNNYKDILNKYNFDLAKEEIESNNLEEIYFKIIISLIVEEKLKNYDYVDNIFNQIDLKNINITEKLFQNLLSIFYNNKNLEQRYSLVNKNDLFDEEKINFYYLIVKYIFKNSIYLYNIPFLCKARNAILKIIKLNKNEFNTNNNLVKKIEYVIKAFCDSKYYFIKYLGAKFDKLKQILKFYQSFLFDSKKNEIKILEEYINKLNIDEECEKYLSDYNKAENMNKREKIIKYFLEEELKNIRNEDDVFEYSKKWEDLEKKINAKKFKEIEIYKEFLKKYFNNKDNKKELLNIFNEDIYESLIKYFKENEKEGKINKEENNNDEYTQKDPDYSQIINEEIEINSKTTAERDEKIKKEQNATISNIKEKKRNKNYKNNGLNDKENQEDDLYFNQNYDLLYFSEKIGTHKSPVEEICETSNGYFFSYGEKNILLYDSEYRNIKGISFKESISKVSEMKTNIENKKINLLVNSGNKLSEVSITLDNIEVRKKESDFFESGSFKCLELKRNTHLVYGGKGLHMIDDLFSKIIRAKDNVINDGTFKGAIRISKNIFAITSNKILEKGGNILQFYNTYSKMLIKEIKGYSFSTLNGLALIPKEENENINRILLCACKKYTPQDKNGILLVNGNTNINKNSVDIKEPFYDTKKFEVHCFCPLSLKPKECLNRIFNEDNTIIPTDYFLVGGFDTSKGKGVIKLYKLLKSKDIEDTKIEFIQDIEIRNNKQFKGFKGVISSITQSKRDGKILVGLWDGSVYLLSYPDLEKFQKIDEINQSNLNITKVEKKEIIVEA